MKAATPSAAITTGADASALKTVGGPQAVPGSEGEVYTIIFSPIYQTVVGEGTNLVTSMNECYIKSYSRLCAGKKVIHALALISSHYFAFAWKRTSKSSYDGRYN